MVGLRGLEPPTSRLSGVRSNHLSYKPILVPGDGRRFRLPTPFGGDEEDRTPDPLLARQVLSQLSYTPTDAWLPQKEEVCRCYLEWLADCPYSTAYFRYIGLPWWA